MFSFYTGIRGADVLCVGLWRGEAYLAQVEWESLYRF